MTFDLLSCKRNASYTQERVNQNNLTKRPSFYLFVVDVKGFRGGKCMSSIGFGPLGCCKSACFNLRSQVILEGSPLGFKSPIFLLRGSKQINL